LLEAEWSGEVVRYGLAEQGGMGQLTMVRILTLESPSLENQASPESMRSATSFRD